MIPAEPSAQGLSQVCAQLTKLPPLVVVIPPLGPSPAPLTHTLAWETAHPPLSPPHPLLSSHGPCISLPRNPPGPPTWLHPMASFWPRVQNPVQEGLFAPGPFQTPEKGTPSDQKHQDPSARPGQRGQRKTQPLRCGVGAGRHRVG